MNAMTRRALAIIFSISVILASGAVAAEAVTTPTPATGVKISPTVTSAKISWNAAAGAVSYRVCLQEFADQSPCARISARSTARTVTFHNLVPTSGTDYYVVVYSYHATKRAATYRKGFNLLLPAKPAAPTNIVRTVSAHSLTVTWSAAARADTYYVCLMTTGDSTTCDRQSSPSPTRSATFDNLETTSGTDYYVRVFARNEGGDTGSIRYSFNLPVGTVTGVSVTRESGTSRVHLAWAAGDNAEQYQLQSATNPSMTSGLHTYTLAGTSATLTKLTLGTTYHFRIRGTNGAALGAWTAAIRFRLASDPSTVVVLTYNLCGQDKCVTSANQMKKWTVRKAYAGRIARGAHAGVIATQESHDKDTQFGTELPGYSLGAYYSAKSLFYDSAKYEKQRSGMITLDSTQHKYAVWVQLVDRVTRTIFIVSDAHLQPYKGSKLDAMREAQTKKLLAGITAINPNKFPVIYAGDYNSNESNANQTRYPGGYDAPKKVFDAAGIPDAFDVAETKVNSTWNSSNQATNPPIRHSDHIDHIFFDAMIQALQFKVILSLDGDQYATPFASDHNPVRATLRVPGH